MWTEVFPLIGIMLSISLFRSFFVLLLATIVSPAAANHISIIVFMWYVRVETQKMCGTRWQNMLAQYAEYVT
jgi:hypothetical protein